MAAVIATVVVIVDALVGVVVDAWSGGSFSQSSRMLGFILDGVGSKVVGVAVGVVSGGICIVVGRTCHDSEGRRYHRGR